MIHEQSSQRLPQWTSAFRFEPKLFQLESQKLRMSNIYVSYAVILSVLNNFSADLSGQF